MPGISRENHSSERWNSPPSCPVLLILSCPHLLPLEIWTETSLWLLHDQKGNPVTASPCQRGNFPQSCSCFMATTALTFFGWFTSMETSSSSFWPKLRCWNIHVGTFVLLSLVFFSIRPHISKLFKKWQWCLSASPALVVCEDSTDMGTPLVSPSILKIRDCKNVTENGQFLKYFLNLNKISLPKTCTF